MTFAILCRTTEAWASWRLAQIGGHVRGPCCDLSAGPGFGIDRSVGVCHGDPTEGESSTLIFDRRSHRQWRRQGHGVFRSDGTKSQHSEH